MSDLKINISSRMFLLSLKALSVALRISPRLRREIDNPETGFVFNARYVIRTKDDSVIVHVVFRDGRMKAGRGAIDNPDTVITYRDKKALAENWSKSGEATLDCLLTNEMSYSGNMAYLSRFAYVTGLLTGGKAALPTEDVIPVDIEASREKTSQAHQIGRAHV